MFWSLFQDHLQGSSFALSVLTTLQLQASSFVCIGMWSYAPLFVCVSGVPATGRYTGKCRDLLHAANLRHETEGFTSPPKEGMLRIFSPEKSEGFSRVCTLDLGYRRPAC
jgi:hypothetical protein